MESGDIQGQTALPEHSGWRANPREKGVRLSDGKGTTAFGLCPMAGAGRCRRSAFGGFMRHPVRIVALRIRRSERKMLNGSFDAFYFGLQPERITSWFFAPGERLWKVSTWACGWQLLR